MSQDSKFLLLGFPALGGGVHPLQFNLRKGLEFSIKNLTSSMCLGIENPTVSGRKRKRLPVTIIKRKQSTWNLEDLCKSGLN